MRTITIAAAILAATTATASASCGGEWSFSGGITEKDWGKHNIYDPSVGTATGGYYTGSQNLSVFDDRNEYNIGIRFTMPLGDDDCDYIRAKSAKERDLGRKAKADAAKAKAEADYAANRAMKEEEFAIAKRIDNLQRIIVTCKTEDLAICDKIDEMSMELFN